MIFTTTSSETRTPLIQNKLLIGYIGAFLICWITTFIHTTDYANWWTENTLTILSLSFLIFTYRKFKFSDLSYTFIFIFILLHIYGAEYTYSENPMGYKLKEWLGWNRNHYDRIVHFSFGLLLGYPLRDYFTNWFKWPKWVCWVLPIEITLSFSCLYEIIEWLVADIFFKSEGIAYLGTQGDIWDAEKDMALALIGAVLFVVLAQLIRALRRQMIQPSI